MICEVTLGGHTDLWNFRDSAGLAAWLGSRPWLGEGGVCLVRTTPGHGASSVVDGLKRAAYAANADQAVLRLAMIDEPDPSETPLEALGRCIGDVPQSRYDAMRLLAGSLRDPHLFVVTKCESLGPAWWDGVRELVDYAAKAPASGPLALIAIDQGTSAALEPVFDMRSGKPTGGVLTFAASAQILMWQAYVHHRIAWEAAGSLELARRLDNNVAGLAAGDENGLEQCFNAFADQGARERQDEFKRLPRLLAAASSSRPRADGRHGPTEDARALERAGLLWSTGGQRAPRVTPWAARALVRSHFGREHKWPLRNALVCLPLAGELLRLCFELESRIRAAVLSQHVFKDPSKETLENFDRFVGGKHDSVAYPAEYPVIPKERSDVWAFASLGEVLMASPARAPEVYWEALHLRNAIAHGHYVCWYHVMKAVQLARNIC